MKNKHSLVFPQKEFILVATSNCSSLRKSVKLQLKVQIT